MMIGQ